VHVLPGRPGFFVFLSKNPISLLTRLKITRKLALSCSKKSSRNKIMLQSVIYSISKVKYWYTEKASQNTH